MLSAIIVKAEYQSIELLKRPLQHGTLARRCKMKLKHEIFIVKIIALIIILLTLLEISTFSASGATKQSISRLFMSYNRKLSRTQANYFADLAFEAGAKYHISPALIAAIIVCESSARPNVISKGGDYGLMQVRYKVHKVKNLLNPRVNIFAGTRILAQYRKGRTLKVALKRYSGGSKKYARKILKVLRKIDN